MTAGFFNSSLIQGPENGTYIQPAALVTQEANGFIAMAALFLPLCWLTVGLRVYVRTRLIRAFGADDWAMLVTLAFFTIYTSLIWQIGREFGQHPLEYGAGETPTSDYLAIIITIAYCFYSATMIAFKFSMGFFFLKIFAFRTRYIITIWATIAIPTVLGIANIIYTILRTCEIEELFLIGLRSCDGYTHSQGWLAIAEVWTVVNTLSDILYAVLCIIAIVKMQMRPREKITAVVLCALGSIGCLASIIRLALFIFYLPVYSLLGESMMEAIWTVIEPGLGITAASLATLRPLLKVLTGDSPTRSDSIAPSGVLQGSKDTSKMVQLGSFQSDRDLVEAGPDRSIEGNLRGTQGELIV